MSYCLFDNKSNVITIKPFLNKQNTTATPWSHILHCVLSTTKHKIRIIDDGSWSSSSDYERILKIMKRNKFITHLQLSNSPYIFQCNLQLVSDTIRYGNITSILLFNIGIRDDHIRFILEMINLNKLKHLYIIHGGFTKNGFDVLIKAVRDNFVLLDCLIEPCFEYNLDDIFDRNQKLTKQSIHSELLNFIVAFSSVRLPQYVLLWIFDWTTPYIHLFHHHFKIGLIERVLKSIKRLKHEIDE